MTKQREIRDQVLELIENLEVGDAIPSERLLGSDLGVSRLTVRAALDELVREGRLTRRRGAGTFVAEPKVAKGMTITSFSDDMRQRGLTPGSRTLEFRTIPAGARLGRILHVSPSEPVLAVKRLRLADGEPMAMELLHVPEALFPGLTARDLEESSFYDLLAQPLRDRDRRRHADRGADRHERRGVVGARRPAALAGAAVRARDARPRAARWSSSRARSTAATATASSRSSASAAVPPCRSASRLAPSTPSRVMWY